MFAQKLRHALGLLRKNIGVTTVALLTLAIGIGASTAIFSVAYAVLLKPLPYNQPDDTELLLARSIFPFVLSTLHLTPTLILVQLLCFVRFVHTPGCPPPPPPNRNYTYFIAKGLISRLHAAFSLWVISFRETA